MNKKILTLFLIINKTYGITIPVYKSQTREIIMRSGKGFGGGEATRDPNPTQYNLNDPKEKQTAIFKAETFAEYMARRHGNNIKPKKSKRNLKAETFTEYIARRNSNNKEINKEEKNDKLEEKKELYIDYMTRRRKEYLSKLYNSDINYNRGRENDN